MKKVEQYEQRETKNTTEQKFKKKEIGKTEEEENVGK